MFNPVLRTVQVRMGTTEPLMLHSGWALYRLQAADLDVGLLGVRAMITSLKPLDYDKKALGWPGLCQGIYGDLLQGKVPKTHSQFHQLSTSCHPGTSPLTTLRSLFSGWILLEAIVVWAP